MAICRSCLEEIQDGAERCPYCRAVQMGTARRLLNEFGTVLLLIVAALILLALVAPFWK